MRSKLGKILLLFILVLNVKCQEDEDTARNYPRLKTLPVSEITKEGATFNAEIIYRGDFEIINYGFVWDYATDNPTIEKNEQLVYSNNLNSKGFSERIESSLVEGYNYYVRAFVQTNDFLVYGEILSFTSLGSNAPNIDSFTPTSGTWGDTLNITGKKFGSKPENITVKLGELETEVIFSTDSTISVLVPAVSNDKTVKLKVSIAGNSSTAKDGFIYLSPSIFNISPTNVTFGDTVTINGENFGRLKQWNEVLVEKIKADITEVNSNTIKFIVPYDLKIKTNKMEVSSVGYPLMVNQNIILKSPEITGFRPKTATKPNQIITIYGKNFHPDIEKNIIEINGLNSIIKSFSRDSIEIELPNELIPYYHISVFETAIIGVRIGEQIALSKDELKIHWQSTWTKKKDFPGLARKNAVTFSIGNYGYFGTGIHEKKASKEYLNDFWKYDPSIDEWIQINAIPGNARASASTFTIGNTGFVGLGTKNLYASDPKNDSDHFRDFFSYNSLNNTWIKLVDFPGIGRHSAASFSQDSKGYVFTGWWGSDDPQKISNLTNEGWEYDPTSQQWTKLENFPFETSKAVGFNSGNQGYIYFLDKLYKYENKNWKILPAETNPMWNHITFGINDKLYYGLGTFDPFFFFEFNSNTLKTNYRLTPYQLEREGASVFVINNKAYIIGGSHEGVSLKDVWEFDPSKPDI
jgi:N-acetylneuraminic acid mutarotase